MQYRFSILILSVLIIFIFILNLNSGNAQVSLFDFSVNETAHQLILNYRLPKSIAAVLAGISLSVSGLILQELFRNPLADPSVLGITSASGLGVAFVVFLASFLGLNAFMNNPWLLCLASFMGAFLALILLLYFSAKINSTVSLIIIGMMIAGFSSALIGLLQFFAPSEKIKTYLIWTFGSFSGLSWNQISVFLISTVLGISITLWTLKGISGMRLGENYAHSMGINIRKARWGILFSSAVLTAAATAFVGPVAFVGLAVPHICRMFFKVTEISKLLPLVILTGTLLMLFFVWLTQIFNGGTLPVNIITSLVGTPIVVSIILNRKKYRWNEE